MTQEQITQAVRNIEESRGIKREAPEVSEAVKNYLADHGRPLTGTPDLTGRSLEGQYKEPNRGRLTGKDI